jgi:hypothetical protein
MRGRARFPRFTSEGLPWRRTVGGPTALGEVRIRAATRGGKMELAWTAWAAILSFAIAAIFAGGLRLPRNLFLLVYVPLAAGFFIAFVVVSEVDVLTALEHHWGWGLLGAGVAGAAMVKNVRSQPSSPRSTGAGLLLDVLWPGIAYGLLDALLLSVLPVLAVKSALVGDGWPSGWAAQLGFGGVALLASLLVTAAYHLGYPEFRGKPVFGAMLGNGILTLAYLLTQNPLAPLLSHAAMHVAAILHGRETTVQLPPHYAREDG